MEKNFDELLALAAKIDQLDRDIDPYGYDDDVSDQEENIRQIAEELQKGNLASIEAFFQDAIDEGTEEECEEQAKELLAQLAEYKASAGS